MEETHGAGPDRKRLALNLALNPLVRLGSPPSAPGHERAGAPLTCYDERRRTAVDGRSALAKVGVAGSNPVVRSNKKRRSDHLFASS
jgi:hypothetical protein